MSAYKVLHPDKTQGTIFSSDSNVEKSGEEKIDVDAMEIDEVKKKREEFMILSNMCRQKLQE